MTTQPLLGVPLGLQFMSYSHSRPFKLGRQPVGSNGAENSAEDFQPARQMADSAIDAALRSVPLPQGLITRLGLLVYTMPEDASDRVDWLGC